MSKYSKELTPFLIIFGVFKYLIILFSLYNRTVSKQYFIYDMLFDFLSCFIQVYYDNIFINNKML